MTLFSAMQDRTQRGVKPDSQSIGARVAAGQNACFCCLELKDWISWQVPNDERLKLEEPWLWEVSIHACRRGSQFMECSGIVMVPSLAAHWPCS